MSQPLRYRPRLFIAIAFIIVFYPESDTQVYLDGVLSDQTSLFERGIFIDDLKPATYQVEVRKKGYQPWSKTLEVREKRVTEGYPFLIPEIISTSSVPRFITLSSGTSVTNGLYADVVKLFSTSTASTTSSILKFGRTSTSSIVASSTAILKKDIEISIEKTKVIASWKGSEDSTPFYFCDAERLKCGDDFVVTEGNIKYVDFYPGRNDVIIYSTKEGIFATELDKRAPQNTRKLLSGDLDFKEDDQRVFIKDKAGYYELIFTASSTLINAISI